MKLENINKFLEKTDQFTAINKLIQESLSVDLSILKWYHILIF